MYTNQPVFVATTDADVTPAMRIGLGGNIIGPADFWPPDVERDPALDALSKLWRVRLHCGTVVVVPENRLCPVAAAENFSEGN